MLTVQMGTILGDILLKEGLISSKNEFRRLVLEGGVRIFDTGEVVKDAQVKITKPVQIKVGKRRFVNIKILNN